MNLYLQTPNLGRNVGRFWFGNAFIGIISLCVLPVLYPPPWLKAGSDFMGNAILIGIGATVPERRQQSSVWKVWIQDLTQSPKPLSITG